MNNKILVIAGPTAVGKTSASVEIAEILNGEIVSADSMQIYQGLDIGTAKPTQEEKRGIPHYMMDICPPSQRFSVAQYVKMADEIVDDILTCGKLPIIVGGTGLYIDNLIYANDFGELDIDLSVRQKLSEEFSEKGSQAMLDKLFLVDPEYAAKLHLNDSKRIIHALEIFYSTGITQSELIAKSRTRPPKYNFLYLVLDCSSRALLYERINTRVDCMMNAGLLEEAKKVIFSEWYSDSTASQAIGYKEFVPYFNNGASLDSCVSLLKQHSRNYAKRQLTWFRNKSEAQFIYVDKSSSPVNDIVRNFKEI